MTEPYVLELADGGTPGVCYYPVARDGDGAPWHVTQIPALGHSRGTASLTTATRETHYEIATEETQNSCIQDQDEDLTQDAHAPSLGTSDPRSSLTLIADFAQGVLDLELDDRTLCYDSEADSRDGKVEDKFSETGSRDDQGPTLQRATIIHATETLSPGRGGSERTQKVRDKPGWCWREANDGALLQKRERETRAKIDTLANFLSRQPCFPSSEDIYSKLLRPASMTPFASRPSTAEGAHRQRRRSSSPDHNPDTISPVSSTFLSSRLSSRPSTAEGLRPPSRGAVAGESSVTDKGDVRTRLAAEFAANKRGANEALTSFSSTNYYSYKRGANEAGENCRVARCLSSDMLLVPRPAIASRWIPPTIRRKRRCEQKRINGKPQPNTLPSHLQRTYSDADFNPQHAIHGQGGRWVSKQLSKEIEGQLGSMMMSNKVSLVVTTLPPSPSQGGDPSPSSPVSLSGSFARSHRQPHGDERHFGGENRGGTFVGADVWVADDSPEGQCYSPDAEFGDQLRRDWQNVSSGDWQDVSLDIPRTHSQPMPCIPFSRPATRSSSREHLLNWSSTAGRRPHTSEGVMLKPEQNGGGLATGLRNVKTPEKIGTKERARTTSAGVARAKSTPPPKFEWKEGVGLVEARTYNEGHAAKPPHWPPPPPKMVVSNRSKVMWKQQQLMRTGRCC
jgi:hypothetical protein